MITIKYIKNIYIRTKEFKSEYIEPDSYIIDYDHLEDVSAVLYKHCKHDYIIQIAEFKNLSDAVEYVKFLCDK